MTSEDRLEVIIAKPAVWKTDDDDFSNDDRLWLEEEVKRLRAALFNAGITFGEQKIENNGQRKQIESLRSKLKAIEKLVDGGVS